MNEQTEKLLREIAAKIGTTGEHLWGVLIQQAYIRAWECVAGIIQPTNWCGEWRRE